MIFEITSTFDRVTQIRSKPVKEGSDFSNRKVHRFDLSMPGFFSSILVDSPDAPSFTLTLALSQGDRGLLERMQNARGHVC
jgi:hypothetical protein